MKFLFLVILLCLARCFKNYYLFDNLSFALHLTLNKLVFQLCSICRCAFSNINQISQRQRGCNVTLLCKIVCRLRQTIFCDLAFWLKCSANCFITTVRFIAAAANIYFACHAFAVISVVNTACNITVDSLDFIILHSKISFRKFVLQQYYEQNIK